MPKMNHVAKAVLIFSDNGTHFAKEKPILLSATTLCLKYFVKYGSWDITDKAMVTKVTLSCFMDGQQKT